MSARKLTPASFFASLFGVGFIPFAPGSFGTLLAAAVYLVLPGFLFEGWGWAWYSAALLALCGVSVWLSGKAEKTLGHDAPAIVIDEACGFFVTVLLLPRTLPVAIYALTYWFAGKNTPIAVNIALSLLIVAAIGLSLYRIVFQPLAHTSVLVLLIASVGCHLALQGLGLVFFGAEGQRGPTISDAAFMVGPLRFTGQSIAVYAITIAFIVGLWLFFGLTLYGKALRATAVNRLGARLVGIRRAIRRRCRLRLHEHDIQLAIVYTADPSIAQNDLVSLEDNEGLFLASHLVPLASDDVTTEAAAIIDGVSAAMSPDELIALNNRSVTEQLPAADIAADWLTEEGLA